jgi:hypothetical protein
LFEFLRVVDGQGHGGSPRSPAGGFGRGLWNRAV